MKDGQFPTARFFCVYNSIIPVLWKIARLIRTNPDTNIHTKKRPKKLSDKFARANQRVCIDGFAKSLAKCANKNGVLLGTPLLYRLRNENTEVVIL